MTTVDLLDAPQIPSDDVADDKYPAHRNVRVEGTRWKAFGREVGERKRSAWLSDFIDWVVLDGQVWRDAQVIARKRHELLGAVVLAALRRYVARNRHLLANDSDEE